MTKVTLYQFGNSVCCQKVRIVLAAKRLAWESAEVELFRNAQYDPAYLKLNPAGVVPTLVHGEDVITESTLICEYLDELYPDPPLLPVSAAGRAEARRWSKLADEGLHEGVSEISFSAMFRERMKTMSAEAREVRFANVGDPRRHDRFESTYRDGARSPWVGYGVAAFERCFARLETTLADGRHWVAGAEPSLGDIGLMPYVARLAFLGLLPLWLEGRPAVEAWWRRAQEWFGYQQGIAEPMLLSELAEMGQHGPAIAPDISDMLQRLRASPNALSTG